MHASGRLLIFAEPLSVAQADAKNGPIKSVDVDPLHPEKVTVAALEVDELASGVTVDVNVDLEAFPQAFSRLEPGRYVLQAVLDQSHSYAHTYIAGGRTRSMLLSPVTEVNLPAEATLILDHAGTQDETTTSDHGTLEAETPLDHSSHEDIRPVNFVSPSLTKFWGRPIHMKGWVVLPPGYAASRRRYPVAYWTHGFGATPNFIYNQALKHHRGIQDGSIPPMIWVFLDENLPTGTHEFADSVNNGSWGHALTSELIPELERIYRMDRSPPPLCVRDNT